LNEHEEEEITLEEEIKILQEQGLPPEKIVEEILKEDINADVNILANTLKMDKMDIGRIKGRLSSARKRRAAKAAPAAGEKAAEEEGPLYKGELDTTRILKDILTKHPDIPGKVVEEVCSWAEYGPIHPTQLVSLLQSFRGITATTAYIVAQKYALALQKAQLEGKVAPMVVGGSVTPQATPQTLGFFPTGLPGAPMSGGIPPGAPSGIQTGIASGIPYGVQPGAIQYGGYPTPIDPRALAREVAAILDEKRPKTPPEPEGDVVIEDPVRDNEGNVILDPDGKPIYKRIKAPAGQAGRFSSLEDPEERALRKMKQYRDLFGSKEELTESKIRSIIKEERPVAPTSTETPITLEDVKKASSEAAHSAVATIVEAHEKEDKEERRHKELLDSNRAVIAAVERSTLAKAVEGYKGDEYRILGQGLSEVGGAIKDRRPVEVIIKDGGRLLFGGTPEKEVEAGAGEGLLRRLKERGWVVEQ